MKIALICTEKLPVPPILGGAVQIYIDGVLPYLSKKHQITVFSIDNPALKKREKVNGVDFIRLPASTKKEYLDGIKVHLKKFDLVHILNRPLWVNYLAKDNPNTKFSLSLHNEMFKKDKIEPQKAIDCIEKVEFINTVSQFIADGVSKLYPQAKDKLNVVYSGIDVDKYAPNWESEGILNKNTLKEKYSLTEYKVVLFVGRLSVKKGVHILLKAMKEVMNKHENVALVIIGSKWFGSNEKNEYTDYLEKLSTELKGPIVFTGFLTPDQIPMHYNLGDVFVCASQWEEPLARVHYEAMGAGLPIITTNRGGNAEVILRQKNGIVIDDYTNPNAFANEITKILFNEKTATNMGKKGRELAQGKYNWERVANDILQAIDKINTT